MNFRFSRASPRGASAHGFLAVRRSWRGSGVACFWATSLEKYRRRDRAHLVPPNVGWMQQSPAVRRRAIFRSEAREVLGSETARLRMASRRRGCRVAARGARAALDDADAGLPEPQIVGG